MPEFRFRRKKQGQNRRTTVNDPEETAKQIQAAKQLVKPVLEPTREVVTNGVGGDKGVASLSIGIAEEEDEEAVEDGAAFLRQSGRNEKRSSFVQEREKFFELLKAKYPEQACSLEMGVASIEEGVGVAGGGEISMFKEKPMVRKTGCETIITELSVYN